MTWMTENLHRQTLKRVIYLGRPLGFCPGKPVDQLIVCSAGPIFHVLLQVTPWWMPAVLLLGVFYTNGK